MVATADGRLVVLGGRTFVNSEAIVRPDTRWQQALLFIAGHTIFREARFPAGSCRRSGTSRSGATVPCHPESPPICCIDLALPCEFLSCC